MGLFAQREREIKQAVTAVILVHTGLQPSDHNPSTQQAAFSGLSPVLA